MTIEHPYLTDSEMREICAPLTRACAIHRWFERNGFVTKKKPNGMPLVSRAHYNEVMSGCTTTPEPKQSKVITPDLERFKAQFKKQKSLKVEIAA